MSQVSVINQNSIVVVDTSRQGPVGDVNPEMYVIEAATEAARDVAIAQANIAINQATLSTTQAGVATTQAGIATTQSAAAASSATAASDSATIATTQATASQTSRVAAENAVASVTVGSTNSLAYPEQVRNLITATDVVDVLVYDTRLDSDGGAWTERCTGTSWYQETLNTATRGAKRAFPKVALIVVRSGSTNPLSIYDALDLDGSGVPRLWRIFTIGGVDSLTCQIFGAATTTGWASVFAVNGRIFVGNATFLGHIELNFPADRAFIFRNGGTYTGNYRGGIATSAAGVDGRSSTTLSNTVTSVHARVMLGAPLDLDSGLPIPTVAVATAGGLSVIHPDRRVSNVTASGGYSRARFTDDNRIIAITTGAPDRADVGPIPYATTTANGSWRTHRVGSFVIGVTGGIILPDAVLAGSTLVDLAEGAVAQGNRLALIAEDTGDVTASMVASIGPNFNSGWMPSTGIQLASLCDGTAGSVTGSGELATNGDAGTGDLTGWTDASTGGASVTVVANAFFLDATIASSVAVLRRAFTTVIGEAYQIAIGSRTGSNVEVRAGIAAGGATVMNITSTGAGFFPFIATATTTWVEFRRPSSATTTLDNLSFKLVAVSRSYQSNSLEVVGTLSRTAVGTGNDLVAWSGFSASNYLTQPYNAGFDVGTGDFFVCGWANVTQNAECILERRFYTGGAYSGFGFALISGSPNWFLRVFNGAANVATASSTFDPLSVGWVFVAAGRRNGVLEIWINGVREGTAANTSDLTNTSAIVRVGGTQDAGFVHNGSLALVRAGSYMPTPGQIERMHRDERRLFQAGAKAFLGMGETAAARRISRSRFTGRLAVAMSDGLALFDGLQRVERHNAATLSPAMGTNDTRVVSMEAGCMLVGTTLNIGVRRETVVGLDRLPANQPTPGAPRIFRARGVTTDATPLILAPRLQIGERETVVVWVQIVGRVYGASDTQRLTYERRATYYRDAGGNVTLAGSVQTIGTDVEVTSTADATLVIDTTAQTVATQVTGISGTRLVWAVRYQIERSTQETSYEEVV